MTARRFPTAYRRWLPLLLVWTAGGWPWLMVRGQEEPPRPPFRRVLVPEEDLPTQIQGLLPLRRDEFERRLRALSPGDDAATSVTAGRIDGVRLTARCEDQQLVGAAEFDVSVAGTEPGLLDLEPCNVSLSAATWDTVPPSAASLGADPQGKLRCLAPTSGLLRCSWTAGPGESDGETTVYLLRLPAAPRRTLEIRSPAELLWSAPGIVETSEIPGNSAERSWLLHLPGDPAIRLEARRANAAQPPPPSVAVQERTEYELLPSIVDLRSTFILDLPRAGSRQLTLVADAGLQVTQLEVNGQRVEFTTQPYGAAQATAIRCELSEQSRRQSCRLQVQATANWPSRGPYRLPRLSLIGGLLQDGQVTVAGPAWLRLQPRAAAGCVLSSATAASAGRSQDEFAFQVFDVNREIEIITDSSPADVQEASGASFTFESNQVKGVLMARLSAPDNHRYELEVQIPRPWIVDSIESDPPEALADRSFASGGANQQNLTLKFARPLSSRPLTLIVRAHARRPAAGQSAPSDFFALAKFTGVHNFRRLLAIDFDEPGAELIFSEAEGLQRLDSERLAAPDLELFETPPRGMTLEWLDPSRPPRGALTSATARYRADVVVTARPDERRWRHEISAHCQPIGSSVRTVLVRVAPRPEQPVQWWLTGSDEPIAVAGATPGAASGPENAAIYRLTLPRGRSSPFELRGEWSSPAPRDGEISLVWLPEADAHTGVIEVHRPAAGDVALGATELSALPLAGGDRATTLRARFRYDASRGARLTAQLRPSSALERTAAIHQLDLTSHFSAQGPSHHEARVQVVHAGLREVRLAFDREVTDLRWIDSAGQDHPLSPGGSGEYLLPLPPHERTAEMRLQYAARLPARGSWLVTGFVAPVPRFDLPVLVQRWTVQLPPGFVCTETIGAPPPTQVSAIGESYPGWNLAQRPLPAMGVAVVAAHRPAQCYALALGVLVAAVAGAALLKPTGWSLLSLAAFGAAAALLLPPPANVLLLGCAAGMGLAAVYGVIQSRSAPSPVPSAPALASAAAPIACWLAFSLASAASLRARAETQPPAAPGKRPRVVIPVDRTGRPTGDYVYLDSELYRAIYRRSESQRDPATPWLLAQTHYQFPLATRTDGPGAVVDDLHVVYLVHTLVPNVSFAVPLPPGRVVLHPGSARLNGHPVALQRGAGRDTLTVHVDQPGLQRLELSLSATAQRTPAGLLFESPLAPAAQTLVSLPGGEVEMLAPARIKAADGRASLHKLPNAARLVIRWPHGAEATRPAGDLQADQLLWWKVRPGSVVLEGLFRLRPLGGECSEAVIAVDPRLRLLPSALAAGSIQNDEQGGQDLLRVKLAEPTAEPFSVKLAWLWPEASGLGSLLLPEVQARADRIERRWIAVSGDGEHTIEAATSLPPVNTGAFLDAWGTAGAAPPPALVFQSAASPRAEHGSPLIRVRPANRLPRAEQSIDWSLGGTFAKAQLTARWLDVPASPFAHRLSIPPQCKVTRVDLTQGGQSVALRWLQQADGALEITAFEPAAPELELNVAVELSLSRERRRLPLPDIRLTGAVLESQTVRIFRRRDALVTLQSPAGWTEIDEPASGAYHVERGRLVATLRNEAAIGSTQPVLARRPNVPQVTGRAFARAQEADGDWQGEVALALHVAGGVLDELRLEVPQQWSASLQLDPPLPHHFETLPGQRRLVIRPPQAIGGDFELNIRGSLAASDTGWTVPEVQLIDARAVERVVLLDRGRTSRRIDWETTGLVAVERTALNLPRSWQGLDGELLRAVGGRFDATGRLRQDAAAAPTAPVAWISTRLASRQAATVAHYLIHPAGARQLRFSLPTNCRLVQSLVDGVPVAAVHRGLREWSVSAASTTLPWELTIVYDGAAPAQRAAPSGVRLAAPALPDVRVERTVWEVAAEHPEDLALPPSMGRVSAAELILIRLEQSSLAWEEVAVAAGGSLLQSVLVDSAARWQSAFEQALAACPEALAREPSASPDFARRRAAAIARARAAQERLAQGQPPAASSSGQRDEAATFPIGVANLVSPRRAFSEEQPPLRLVLPGPTTELPVTLRDQSASADSRGTTGAILLLGVGILCGPLRRWPRAWLTARRAQRA